MKKYTLFLFVLAFVLLGSNANFAKAANCAPGDLFNTNTGQPCSTTTTVVGCLAGYLFSPVTGQPCSQANSGIGSQQFGSAGPLTMNQFNSLYKNYFVVGSRGNDVRALQQFLKEQGYYFGIVDGKYGAISARAVKDFKDDNASYFYSNPNMAGGLCPSGQTWGGSGCVSQNGVDTTAPHINAVAPSTVSVGSSITITGKWLMSGKDADYTSTISNMVVWLKNSQGVAAPLPLTTFVNHNENATSPNLPLSATVSSKLCRTILFQGSCPDNDWLQITPGIYTLYIQQDTHVGMATVNSNSVTLTVTSNNTQPSITVLSPASGENLVAGSVKVVRWSSVNLTSSDHVNIWLIDNANSSPDYQHYSQELIHATINDGSESITVPAQLSGSFELRVQLTNGRDNSGSSYITITN